MPSRHRIFLPHNLDMWQKDVIFAPKNNSKTVKKQEIIYKERQTLAEDEVEAFLFLLRASLWGNFAPEEGELPDLHQLRAKAIWQLAEEQTVLGHLTEALQKLYGSNLPAEYKLRIKQNAAKMFIEHQLLKENVRKTFDFLQSQGFSPILLKGQGNAARYRDPMLRQCGDIDVYIGKKDYQKACACIGLLVGEEAVKQAEQSRKHMHVNHGKISIELHRIAEYLANPLTNLRYQRLTQYWLHPDRTDTVAVGDYQVQVPGKQFNVFYVFNHFWHHFTIKGVGLRQICDWCMILHEAAGKIDVAQLEKDLRQLHLLKPWQIMAHIAVQKLGLRQEEMPLYSEKYQEQTEKVWKLILKGGNFGEFEIQRNYYNEPYLYRKAKSFVLHHKNYYRLMSISAEDAFFSYFHILYTGIEQVIMDIFVNKRKLAS